MLGGLEKLVVKYPGSFGNWACFYLELVAGTSEIVIIGEEPENLHLEVLKQFIPHRVIMMANNSSDEWPLLRGKNSYERPAVFLCSNYSCLPPVFSVKDLMSLINSPQNR